MNLERFLEVRVSTDRFLLACVAGAWKQWAQEKTGAREGDTRRKRLTPRVSPSGAPVLSFAHYFQAPATQASFPFVSLFFFHWRLNVKALPVLGCRSAQMLEKKRASSEKANERKTASPSFQSRVVFAPFFSIRFPHNLSRSLEQASQK